MEHYAAIGKNSYFDDDDDDDSSQHLLSVGAKSCFRKLFTLIHLTYTML